MYSLGKIRITTVIPDELSMLTDIAHNLWWSWNNEAIDLYREIDLELWEQLGKNPVRFLQEVSNEKIEAKLNDQSFMHRYKEVTEKFSAYLTSDDTWFNKIYPDKKDFNIIYFSAEYGLHEILPIYSGGLGVLSGDHCKAASDLGLPFTAVGLFYKQGYFNQQINSEGWQETEFVNLNTNHLPIKPVFDTNGNQLLINIDLPGRIVYAKIWKVSVGRISIYLMDTDVPQNNQYDKGLTARLYGGDRETRIQQEFLLGIGGIRLLDTLNIKGSVYHMNEGHSAFMGLELARKLVQEKNMPFNEAQEIVRSSSVFTTHTPVPAGNDTFPIDMIERYFSNYWGQLNIGRHEFINLGIKPGDEYNFNMTVLALSFSSKRNGVSELHGAVSRNMFLSVWSGIPEDDIPIDHITNGIHTLTWMAPNYKYLFDCYLPIDWKEKLYDPEVWENINDIPNNKIWKIHCNLKEKMIVYISEKLKEQYLRNGAPLADANAIKKQLNPKALTIGFARRFATYKRAALIFRDLTRIEKILNSDKPLQIIFAGKAHPADRPAHEVIKHINDIAKREGFRGKVFILENYNMTIARNLVQGVDVWMNNPRRPLEASGTSGQKVSINGILNFSILDGWWCEGYNGKNGWVIGNETEYENENNQDDADSRSMYSLLEKEIIPIYYDRNDQDVPEQWVEMMKESIKSITPVYSTHRMVQDYTNNMYTVCIDKIKQISESEYEYTHSFTEWKNQLRNKWHEVQIIADKISGNLKNHNANSDDIISLEVIARLGSVKPEDVKLEVYCGEIENDGIKNGFAFEAIRVEQMDNSTYKYHAEFKLDHSGEYGYTFRIIPYNDKLINKFDLPLIKWA